MDTGLPIWLLFLLSYMLLGITEKEFELEHGLILLTNNTQRLVKDL